MPVEIIDQDFGFKEFTDKIKEITKSEVLVGYTQASGSEDGTKIVDIAIKNEVGTDIIPARPFMRLSFDNNVNDLGDTGENLLVSFLEDKIDAELTYEIWGDSFKSIMQKGVITRSLGLEENAPSTIAKKGSDTPLIDTGRMINSAEIMVGKK